MNDMFYYASINRYEVERNIFILTDELLLLRAKRSDFICNIYLDIIIIIDIYHEKEYTLCCNSLPEVSCVNFFYQTR